MPGKDLTEVLFGLVESSVGEKGVYPQQCAFTDREGQMTLLALAVSGTQALDVAAEKVKSGEAVELVVGIDMWTKEDQGTEFEDVVVVCHFKDGNVRVGVIDYQNEPRIVRPLRWDNEHWPTVMMEHLGIST